MRLKKPYKNKPLLALALRCIPTPAFEDNEWIKPPSSSSVFLKKSAKICDNEATDGAETEKDAAPQQLPYMKTVAQEACSENATRVRKFTQKHISSVKIFLRPFSVPLLPIAF